jgi:hypothetical protein
MTNLGVASFAVNGTALFAGTGGGIFRSTDAGTNWAAANTGLTNYSINCFAVSGTDLFAGILTGVVLSTNNGANWTSVSTGLSGSPLALAVEGTTLLVGTQYGGVWKRQLSEMITDVDNGGESPAVFTLKQNYPNPFNPNTTIKYELPKPSEVRLSVFDLLGREVSLLVNERRDAGGHEVTFDGSHLASGVYFYRLQAGDFVQSKKLLLMK